MQHISTPRIIAPPQSPVLSPQSDDGLIKPQPLTNILSLSHSAPTSPTFGKKSQSLNHGSELGMIPTDLDLITHTAWKDITIYDAVNDTAGLLFSKTCSYESLFNHELSNQLIVDEIGPFSICDIAERRRRLSVASFDLSQDSVESHVLEQ